MELKLREGRLRLRNLRIKVGSMFDKPKVTIDLDEYQSMKERIAFLEKETSVEEL